MNRPDSLNRIESKVRNARRRWILGLFGRSMGWTMGGALAVVAVAGLVPAFWPIDVGLDQWLFRWLAGSLLVAVLIAAIQTLIRTPSMAAVAAEVDHRFGLRERLGSAMALRPGERDSPFGQALLADAGRRAEALVVSEAFPLRPARIGVLPLLMLPIVAAVWMSVEPVSLTKNLATEIDAAEVRQVKAAAVELKKRVSQQRRKAEAKGIEESRELFKRMEADLDEIAKRKDLDRKQALIAMNDLKKQLEQRREELGSSDQIRKAMSQMKGFDSGPADQLAKSIEKGEFGKAEQVLRDLAQKLRDKNLSESERKQLQQQIEQMKQQMEKSVAEHEQKKQELQQRIEQARSEGRADDAAEMQRQLDQLCQQDGQMGSMGAMADSLSKAAGSMQQGNSEDAADALQQLAGQLGEQQQSMSELQDLDAALGDLAQCKSQMRCESCSGGGCQQCQGNGASNAGQSDRWQFSSSTGGGIGSGTGPKNPTDPDSESEGYESQVRGEVRQGRAVVAGTADGPNRKGVTREDLSHAIETALSEESDPLENQSLPRVESEQAQQYFDRLREGSGS